MMKDSARYAKIVAWSDEDQCFVGSCPGLLYGGCHGDDEKAVFAELCEIVDEMIELYKKDGKPLPPPTSGKNTPTECSRFPDSWLLLFSGNYLRDRAINSIAIAAAPPGNQFQESLKRRRSIFKQPKHHSLLLGVVQNAIFVTQYCPS
jgi:predicted RNase H-like HicB family nuclease